MHSYFIVVFFVLRLDNETMRLPEEVDWSNIKTVPHFVVRYWPIRIRHGKSVSIVVECVPFYF